MKLLSARDGAQTWSFFLFFWVILIHHFRGFSFNFWKILNFLERRNEDFIWHNKKLWKKSVGLRETTDGVWLENRLLRPKLELLQSQLGRNVMLKFNYNQQLQLRLFFIEIAFKFATIIGFKSWQNQVLILNIIITTSIYFNLINLHIGNMLHKLLLLSALCTLTFAEEEGTLLSFSFWTIYSLRELFWALTLVAQRFFCFRAPIFFPSPDGFHVEFSNFLLFLLEVSNVKTMLDPDGKKTFKTLVVVTFCFRV